MVQEIAKEMIQLARQEAAQDLYLIPKSSCYELYMRVGDERRFIQTYDFDLLSSVISHFKFVSGMNVGEKRRSQLGSCDGLASPVDRWGLSWLRESGYSALAR